MGCVVKHNKSTRVISNRISVKRNRCQAPDITNILSSGDWEGQTCFILGGGPSLVNFDHRLIEDQLVIGTNKSFTAPNCSPTINFSMDVRFHTMVTQPAKGDLRQQTLHRKWLGYRGIKVFAKRSPKFKYSSSVYVVNSLPEKVLSFDLGKGVYLGNNSGFGALMLACCLGSKRIGLLGFDLKIDEKTQKIHWHEGYSGQDPKTMQRKFDSFIICFQEFAPTIAQQGIEVVNLAPLGSSKLKCFPSSTINKFLL